MGTLGWLTPREFADAVTLGQITPGPIAITATFVGYRVAGLLGSVVATVGTFAPPFLITVAATHSLEAFRSSRWVNAAMRAVTPVVVGIVAGCLLLLALDAYR